MKPMPLQVDLLLFSSGYEGWGRLRRSENQESLDDFLKDHQLEMVMIRGEYEPEEDGELEYDPRLQVLFFGSEETRAFCRVFLDALVEEAEIDHSSDSLDLSAFVAFRRADGAPMDNVPVSKVYKAMSGMFYCAMYGSETSWYELDAGLRFAHVYADAESG